MSPNDTDKAWEYYGQHNPYWGVLTNDEYDRANLTEAAKTEFFASGENHVSTLLEIVRESLDPTFQPATALDFGCGVGRLVIPLSGICRRVVGIDVSDSMLAEAQRNCEARGITNAYFYKSDDELSNIRETFDFVHSFIVFQHIAVERGEQILRRLIELLSDNAVGALHFTYAAHPAHRSSRLFTLYQKIPFLLNIRNLIKKKPVNEPLMQMNQYNLNRLLQILQENGCHRLHVRFTNHNMYGAILIFQKRQTPML